MENSKLQAAKKSQIRGGEIHCLNFKISRSQYLFESSLTEMKTMTRQIKREPETTKPVSLNAVEKWNRNNHFSIVGKTGSNYFTEVGDLGKVFQRMMEHNKVELSLCLVLEFLNKLLGIPTKSRYVALSKASNRVRGRVYSIDLVAFALVGV